MRAQTFAWIVMLAAQATGRVWGDPTMPAPIEVLTIVVIDCSGSMETDGRLDASKGGIENLSDQLPPSPSTPWVMIPFSDKAQEPVHFDDGMRPMKDYIDSLRADGGTSIAKGLSAAHAVIKTQGSAQHVVMYLISDGEDPDEAALAVEVARLAALFNDRQKSGLGQSVICQRWGNVNAGLVARLKKLPHVDVIDAGSARFEAVVLDPQIEIQGATWSAGDPNRVEVRARVRCEKRGADGPRTMTIRCTTVGAEGDLVNEVPADGTPHDVFISQLVDANTVDSAAHLEFECIVPPVKRDGESLIVATLARYRLAVDVALPARGIADAWSAAWSVLKAATWRDPTTWMAEATVEVTIRVRELPAGNDVTTARMSIEAAGDCRLEGAGTFDLSVPGETKRLVTIVYEAPRDTAASTRLEITLKSEFTASRVKLGPDARQLTVVVPRPSPIVTNVSVRPGQVARPAWSDLVTATAGFEATFDVTVDGLIPADSRLTLVGPPGVTRFDLRPSVLKQGRQTIHMPVMFRPAQVGRPQRLSFAIEPPPAVGPVSFVVVGPLEIDVPAIEPARLAVAYRGRIERRYEICVHDLARPVELPVELAVLGAPRQAAAGLRAALAPRGWAVHNGERLVPGRIVRIQLQPATAKVTSYYRDMRVATTLGVAVEPGTPAVVVVPQELAVYQEAPLKRLLLRLALATVAMLLTVSVGYAYWTVQGQRS